MKFKNYLITAISFLMIVTSCVKIDDTFNNRIPTNPKGEYAIVFSNPNNRNTKAVANSISGTGYDSFSLFSWNSINDTIMKPYLVEADNAASYKYDVIPNQELKYFKKVANWYDFIGVIPTNKTMTLADGNVKVEGLTSFTVDDKKVEQAVNLTDTLYWKNGLAANSPEEFLWAYKRVSKADYGNTVELPFNHGNALVFIGFSSDKTDTKIIDYIPGTPGTPEIPAVPATPDTVKYTKKNVKFIDELVAGSEVQVGIGFYGANSPKLTKTQPNPLYVGSDNTSNGYLAKTWLLSIKDAVNAQFVYYRLNQVVNSTSKTVTTEDWESAASNKNIFMMKLADGVDKAKFAAGNDAFATALKAHQTDWVGGSPAESFWAMFEQAYADGWRVVRINVSDANANQVLVFLSSNLAINTQVCETIPGNPGSPAVPAVPGTPAIEGIRVFSADSTGVNNLPADTLYCVHIPHTAAADATISSTGCVLNNRVTSDNVIQFSLPETTILNAAPIWSPTTFYALPGDTNFNFIVVKLSYTYNGITTYDVRVPIKLPDGGLIPGKYYKYDIYITSTGNGTNDPDEARDEKDEILIEDNPVISVKLIDAGYTQGDERRITI